MVTFVIGFIVGALLSTISVIVWVHVKFKKAEKEFGEDFMADVILHGNMIVDPQKYNAIQQPEQTEVQKHFCEVMEFKRD